MLSRHAERGQTLPVWAFGSLSVLVLLVMVLNYGSMVRWQMRAQNAADAAARGMLAAQTSQWNQTTADLHAATVEEYRIRYLLNDLLEVTQGNGGCLDSAQAPAPNPQGCDQMYLNLRGQYFDAVKRYTDDVALMNRISTPTQQDQITAINAALAQYQANCGQPAGGDCAFKYTVIAAQRRQNSYLENVYADCCAFIIGGGTQGHPNDNLTPLQIEVVACANVPSLIPSFWNFTAQPFTAVGRAAATSIQGTQEFMYLGSVINPTTGKVFQPAEYPETDDGTAAFTNTDDANYRIDYGGNPDNPWNQGNPAVSNPRFGSFVYAPKDQGLLAATGWWTAMPMKPFSGKLDPNKYACQ
jgi:hypothetical protein